MYFDGDIERIDAKDGGGVGGGEHGASVAPPAQMLVTVSMHDGAFGGSVSAGLRRPRLTAQAARVFACGRSEASLHVCHDPAAHPRAWTSADKTLVPAPVSWNLTLLVVRARALSTSRSIGAVASAEPGWFLLVVVALIGSGIAAALRLDPRRQVAVLGALSVVLTLLLTMARRDVSLLRIIGVSPGPVRVFEALLWSSPLVGLAAVSSPRGSALIASVVAVTAYLSVGLHRISRSRGARRVIPGVPASLPEWTVGLRRSAPIIVLALVAGIVGSHSPGIVMVVLAALSLTTCAFFWAPAEGWLLIHAREQRAGRFLSRKLLMSVGMLSALLVPVALIGTIRAPSYGPAYLLSLVMCLHAHAAAVAVKYASYREGRALDAAGSLVWTITALAIVVPPVGILMLLWLYRRAAARIADYCLGATHAR